MSRLKRHFLFCGLALVLASGCGKAAVGLFPPTDTFFWPVALVADPQGDYLYVVNGNFDLNYNTGTVAVVDLKTNVVVSSSTIRLGSFGGDIGLFSVEQDGVRVATRGFVTTRELRALTWFDISRDETTHEPRMNCRLEADPEAKHPPACEDKYVIADNDTFADLGADVFSLAIGQVDGTSYAFTGSLRDTECLNGVGTCAKISAFSIEDGDTQLIAQQDFVIGAHGIAVSPLTGELYVTSRFFDTIQTMKLNRNTTTETGYSLDLVGTFSVGNLGNTGDFSRQIVFNKSGTRAYIAYRNPSSIVVLDTSLDPDDRPYNRILDVVEIGASPSDLKLVYNERLQRDLAYIVCFGTNEIWVLDTELLAVIDRVRIRKGPFKIAVVDNPKLGLKRAYITNFEDNTVTVLELDESSPFYHQEIASLN
ncbi:MAG: hypothetical protein KC609_11220 [Myxococcales bacterium]|nr:hypothetical protein [Myxococcales bacterium]